MLLGKIRRYVPDGVKILSQGEIVAASLLDYLRRHPDMDARISCGSSVRYLTTESSEKFDPLATEFMHSPVQASTIRLD